SILRILSLGNDCPWPLMETKYRVSEKSMKTRSDNPVPTICSTPCASSVALSRRRGSRDSAICNSLTFDPPRSDERFDIHHLIASWAALLARSLVGPSATDERGALAILGVEFVIAGVADKAVAAGAAPEGVVSGSADQRVVAGVAEEEVAEIGLILVGHGDDSI